MKSCEEIRELLSFYLDNELHENDRKQVVKHLEGCDACKAELDQLKNIIESIGEIEEVEMPADFEQKLHEKLVEAHRKYNLVEWTNKGNIFKWASAMVAGFVLLFAVVNSSFFGQLTQFSNSTKTAYVNDAHLDTVDKQAMDNVVQKQEIAQESPQPKNAAQSKLTVNNKLKGSIPASSVISGSGEQKKVNPVTQDNAVIFNDTSSPVNTKEKMNSTILSKTSSMTLTVDDVSGAVAKLNDIVKVNGGSVQEPQAFGIMSTSSLSDAKDLTFQIPAATYNKVVGSIGKIGTVQTQPQVQSNSAQLKTAAPQAAVPNVAESDMVTVKISIQKK